MVDPAPHPFLSARGVSKRFGALTALSGVDLDVRRGEVLALLGDNFGPSICFTTSRGCRGLKTLDEVASPIVPTGTVHIR